MIIDSQATSDLPHYLLYSVALPANLQVKNSLTDVF